MKRILDWLDARVGWRKLTHEALYENVPGGARWRYAWGSTLVFCLMVQFVTGIFLWMNYAPSSQTAWESVWYIQNQVAGGWLLRGLHHMFAHAMIVLMALHLMQVVIDGAYKAPRELNFWTGLVLLQLVFGLSLTGYLLPWDQKGFWATKVATNLLAAVPVVGPALLKLVIGGTDYGHHTLTRFFALHAGVLPGAMIALLVAHVALFRRHGLTAKLPKRKPDAPFWQDQVLKDAVACLAVLVTVLFILVKPRLFGHGAPGIELGAPADPTEPFSAARPDWYFLFLFQFLKYFPGQSEVLGAFVIPGLVFGLIALMPFIGRWKLGHRFNVWFLFTLLIGAGLLTVAALREDGTNATYVTAVRQADRDAERVRELAGSPAGIPVSGAVTLLRNDPLTQGPKIFSAKCVSCHRFGGHDGLGGVPKDLQSASDLKGFASREWLTGLLDPTRIGTTNYFGATRHGSGKMVKFVTKKVAAFTPEKREQLGKVIVAVSAEAGLKSQREVDGREVKLIEEGRGLFVEGVGCAECHAFHKPDPDASGPDLTGYGSRAWLVKFISDPAHADFYGERNDRMPAFGKDGMLSAEQIGLVADWLRGEWYGAESVEALKR
ncbi:MAG: DUF4405 domain-containing protein [Pedosphaera sp.]|nr:DUF4405 domain-containing protein [Pedosphaera sp.]